MITEAVTGKAWVSEKGIVKNEKRPMKPSGVEWIGDVPAGWKVTRIKQIAKISTGTTPPRDQYDAYYSRENGTPWTTMKPLLNEVNSFIRRLNASVTTARKRISAIESRSKNEQS